MRYDYQRNGPRRHEDRASVARALKLVLVLATETRYSATDLVKKRTTDTSTTAAMQSRQRRGRIVRYLIVAVGCVLIIDALVGDRGFLAMLKARQQYRAVETSLAGARADNAQLRERARQLREDPQTIEEIARRELGLIRPGEKLFIIKDVK
jgi:cell division protein FtsB